MTSFLKFFLFGIFCVLVCKFRNVNKEFLSLSLSLFLFLFCLWFSFLMEHRGKVLCLFVFYFEV
uniref:Uncharacterized protein n=1 Tax=Anguilla anguilla TaxID=7936 RepID=A0A0E9PUE2_ANGAN